MEGNSENTKIGLWLNVFFYLSCVLYFISYLFAIFCIFQMPIHYVLCGVLLVFTILASSLASKCVLVFCFIFALITGVIETYVFSYVFSNDNIPIYILTVSKYFFPIRAIITVAFLAALTRFVCVLEKQRKEKREKTQKEGDIEEAKQNLQRTEQTTKPAVPIIVYTNQNMPAEHYINDNNKNNMMSYNAAPMNSHYATPANNAIPESHANSAINPNMSAPVGHYANSNNAYSGPSSNNYAPNQFKGPNGI